MSILWRDPLCVLTAWSIVSRAGSELLYLEMDVDEFEADNFLEFKNSSK